MQERFPDWELVIVGPDGGGEVKRLQRLASALGAVRLSIMGPAYGEEKLALYRSAHLYVLPTRSENFAMTVAEALAAGTPAIVSKGAPWSDLDREGAGWWIDIGAEPLTDCLTHALALPPERLAAMGERGRAWMARAYSWGTIAQEMAMFYAWLCGRGPRPASVRED